MDMGSGLLVKSLFNLQRVDPGLVADNLVSVELDLSSSVYPEERDASDFFREFVQRVESTPGVQAVSFSTLQPLSGAARLSTACLARHRGRSTHLFALRVKILC